MAWELELGDNSHPYIKLFDTDTDHVIAYQYLPSGMNSETAKRIIPQYQLMKQAPVLMSVLKKAVDNNMLVEGSHWWGEVYAAIAKAEGK